MMFDFSGTFARWPELAWGATTTIWLAILSMMLGLLLGSLGAAARLSRHGALRLVPTVYVETIRNTPLLVQIYIIYFGLPAAGIRFTPPVAAVLALGIYTGAYATEILRSGIQSIPKGQLEAARALGLSRWRTLRNVEAGQALAAVYPALMSQFVLVMLATSLVSAISVTDLTASANNIQGLTFRSFEAYLVVAAIYLVLTFVLRSLLSGLERVVCPFKFVGR
ncbi:amino acid ABC transporter permease [Acidisphaera sp. S103]|uniref:amino acid ABC transporter permease n=1 Tax=Acidisphaera sp. S103 TaxID=1747223 RepID=UPI00131BEC0E|nr:amino acid ABC transporter permease [Acidisphaera sp. S103]